MKRKSRIHPSLAPLNDAEREQLAAWLRKGTLETVRERVNKPRPDGFGLNISINPLQRFYDKVQRLDLINSRLPEEKRLSLNQYEQI